MTRPGTSSLLRLARQLRPALLILNISVLLIACAGDPDQRKALSAEFLLGRTLLDSPVDTLAFMPSPDNSPSQHFQGVLEFLPSDGEGHANALIDWFGYMENPDLSITRLPPFSFEFVQDGNQLIPVLRGSQISTHPHWEFILEPGRVWDEAGDGRWSRASLPFALQERNANCTHNGLLSFLFQNDGSVSRVAYQVTSETCQYLQVDLWGVLDARYTPGEIRNSGSIIESFREEVDARLPVKPIAAIADDYPGADPGNFNWFPADEVSTFGFAINGVHYSGGCKTRYGPYPYCEVLDLPSYSLAKSIFAGTAYMALEQEFPGAADLPVSLYVPECDKARWQDVTLQHTIDMTTGNYTSLEPDIDEFASYDTDFMGGETHAQKIHTSCTLFPRKAKPGSTFAYHTSDTYIAGTMMNAFLAEQTGAENAVPRDIHSDVLVEKLMKPLGLSPVTWTTRRTYDEISQPFAGYGLTLHADDIARLGLFLARGDGIIGERQVLDRRELNAALQREPADIGIEAGSADLRYNNGFWAYRTDLQGTCDEAVWIPLMSGYGGISIALLPNGSLFYVFSDKGRFEWLKAAIESHKIQGICE